MDGGDDSTVTGYVIVRYVLWRGASLRIEFGFLPGWAYTGNIGTLEAAVRHAVLPSQRYINRTTIAGGSTVWLFSPAIDIPTERGGDTEISVSSSTVTVRKGENIGTRRVGQVIGPVAAGEFGVVLASRLPVGLGIELGEAVRDSRGRETRALVLTGSVARTTAERTYDVTISVRTPSGQNITGQLAIDVEEGPDPPIVDWDGYKKSVIATGEHADPVEPVVIEGPRNPVWSYRPATAEICGVDPASGRVTGTTAGECEIVATLAPKDGWGEATAIARVRVVDRSGDVVISWEGYEPSRMTVGGDSPLLLRPRATDRQTGRSIPLVYTYERDDASADVCTVSSLTGGITADEDGVCTVRAVSAPAGAYASAASDWVRVVVSDKEPPVPCRLSYAGNVEVDDSATANFFCPDGGSRTFSADDTTVCSINRASGAVTGIAPGTCRIVVNVAETRTTAATTVTAQLTIVPVPSPECDTINNREFSGSQSRVQIDLDRYCDDVDGYHQDSSSNPNVATTSLSGSLLTVSAGGSEGSSTIQVTATNRGGSTTRSFTVTRRTERPVISISCPPPSPMVNESVTCTYSLISGDPPTSFDWRGGASSGSSMRYTTSFSTQGSKTVSLTASNAGGSDSASTTVIVRPSNRAPICDDDPHDVDIDKGDERRFQPRNYCFDPDGDEVTLQTSSSNSRVAIADSDRRGWKFVGQGHGTATITITATDPGGLSDSARVTVNVRGGPDCHDIPDTVLTTINAARQAIDLSRYCRHPSGGSLTYSASTDNTGVARASVSGSTLTISPGSTTGVANVSVSVSGSGLRTRNLNNWFEVIVNRRVEVEPPIPPSGYGLAYCDAGRSRASGEPLYYFEYTARDYRQWTKHHLNMRWEEAAAIWARIGVTLSDSIIDSLSQSQCDQWTTGTRYTASTSFTPRRR